jgi:hypothetical protein
MQIFRIMCKGLCLEIFLIYGGVVADQKIAAAFRSTAPGAGGDRLPL